MGGIPTGKCQDREEVTEEVVYFTGATEVQGENIVGLAQAYHASHSPRNHCQMDTHSTTHSCCIVKWGAYGHIAVKSHGGQKTALTDTKKCEEKHLCGTPLPRDSSGLAHKALQHLGCDRARVANLQERQVGQEEVHGGVEDRVGPDGSGYESIARQ